MKAILRNAVCGFLCGALVLGVVAPVALAADSKLKLEVFSSLPPHPTLRDIEDRAGTPLNTDTSQVGQIIYFYRLNDGSTILAGGPRDRRALYYVIHYVAGVPTKLYPANGK